MGLLFEYGFGRHPDSLGGSAIAPGPTSAVGGGVGFEVPGIGLLALGGTGLNIGSAPAVPAPPAMTANAVPNPTRPRVVRRGGALNRCIPRWPAARRAWRFGRASEFPASFIFCFLPLNAEINQPRQYHYVSVRGCAPRPEVENSIRTNFICFWRVTSETVSPQLRGPSGGLAQKKVLSIRICREEFLAGFCLR